MDWICYYHLLLIYRQEEVIVLSDSDDACNLNISDTEDSVDVVNESSCSELTDSEDSETKATIVSNIHCYNCGYLYLYFNSIYDLNQIYTRLL